MSFLKVLVSALVLFIQLLIVKDAQSQSFLYHRPESDFMDTCVFQCIRDAKVITSSEQYSFRKSIKAMDLKIIEPHLGDFLKEKYTVKRIDLKRGFHDQLRCVYYLFKEGKLIYKIRFWTHGALSIIHFIY